ncbi:MAG TPA: hypothetical protein VGL81_34315 [Polyangiaceae bacterium]
MALASSGSRRLATVVAGTVAALVTAAGACLPSIHFETSPGAADGGEGGGNTGDGSTAPSVIGPFANDQFEDYAQSARCAVYSGQLYCWGGIGSNLTGLLGLPPDTEDAGDYPLPTLVSSTVQPPSQITQMAMGGLHSCTLYGRSVYCRGANGDGELGNPAAGQGGPTEFAVQGLPPSGLDAIAAAFASTCGITLLADAGSISNVYCWGTNGEGELGRPVTQSPSTAGPVTGILDGGPTGAITDAVAIASGGNHQCVLTSSHTILCWGGTEFYECGPAQGSTDCPGGNETTCSAQPLPITLPAGEVPVAIALGDVHSCALAMSGSVYCWGWGNANQLGNTSVTQTCTDTNMATGPCTGTPVKVTNLSGIQLLRAGGAETCAIDQAHHAHCWGYNGDGELGEGDTAPQTAPVEVADPGTGIAYTFDDLAVGEEGVCARSGNTLYCWGNGALGTEAPDGAVPSSESPAPVSF